MEMHQVRYFVALCETLNFTRAAEHCGVAQPSLTKAIQKLEEELGGPLFARERSLTHLTDLGRLMRPHLEAVFHASEAVRLEANSFHKLESGSVRLGVMCTIGPTRLISFLKRFRRELPSIDISLKDAPAIVGKSDGATQYLRTSAGAALAARIRPLVASALGRTGAFAQLDKVGASGMLSSAGISRDGLTGSVTDQTMNGIFKYMGTEEARMRSDPMSVGKKLFGGFGH